jgi:uncharacterized metal-binding protein YceD (DUF177 family)
LTHSAPSVDLVLDELEEGDNAFVLALDPEALELEHEFFVFSGAVDIEVAVRRSINSFSLRGAVKWMLTGECYRCLEEMQELQQTTFELLLQRRQASEEEIVSAEKDGFIEIVDPGTRRVDLADYVREAIVLEMPMRIPSRASGGECPHCGKGEGLVERKAQEQTDQRWDALKKIEFS